VVLGDGDVAAAAGVEGDSDGGGIEVGGPADTEVYGVEVAAHGAGIGLGGDGLANVAEFGFRREGCVGVGDVALEDEGLEVRGVEGDSVAAVVCPGGEADEGLASGGEDGAVVFGEVDESGTDGDGWGCGFGVLVDFSGDLVDVRHRYCLLISG
jgi:hypothetical protein